MPDFDKLERLLAEMEKPELPEGFTWNMGEVLNQVAEDNSVYFGMTETVRRRRNGHTCGTAGCALGVAIVTDIVDAATSGPITAANQFGISYQEACYLFFPGHHDLQKMGLYMMTDITREMQTERIREFIATLRAKQTE